MINVVEALHEVAQKNPCGVGIKIPIRNAWGKLSYIEKNFLQMDEEVDLLATYLLQQGFYRGKKAIVMLPPGENLLRAIFAMLRLGTIPVVIDPGMGWKNFINCVKQTKPDLFLGCAKARLVYHVLKFYIKIPRAVFLTSRLMRSLKKLGLNCHLQSDSSVDDTAAVLFTSGSTGYPKGAAYTYREFNEQIEALRSTFQFSNDEVDLPLLPVFSLYNPALGMTTIVPEMDAAHPAALDPKKIVQAILDHHVTNSFGSPRLWTKIADYCEHHAIQLPSMKRIFLAGAPVHPLLLGRVQALIPNGQAYTPYGATEALPIAYISAKEVLQETYKKTLQGQGTCVGKLIDGVKVRIIPISMAPLVNLPESLPCGEIGEILIHAPYVSQSYVHNSKATRQAKLCVTGETWHRMGDLGYLDEKGRLWFCGRKAERVVTQDGNFYTDCCEAVFNAHKDVARSALIAYNSAGKTVPAIVIEPKVGVKNKRKLLKELRELAKTCPVTQPIKHFCFYKHFPVDVRHNAKIHRLKLAKFFEKHSKAVVVQK